MEPKRRARGRIHFRSFISPVLIHVIDFKCKFFPLSLVSHNKLNSLTRSVLCKSSGSGMYRKFKGMLIRILYQDGKWSWICKQRIPLWKRIFLCAKWKTLCSAYTQEAASFWTVRRWSWVAKEMRKKGPPTGKSSCVLCEQKKKERKHSLPSTGSKSTALSHKRSREKKMIKSIFYPPAFNKICEQQQRKWQQNLSSSPWQKQKKEDFSGHTSVLHEWRKAEKIACEMRFQKGICI